jgi:hypothetical protein
MNADIKRQWLEALRSGEYAQGDGGLQVDGTFCCLGVLCDIAAKQGVGEWEASQGYIAFTVGRQSVTEYLPSHIARWADLPAANPEVNGHRLASYNDGTDGVERAHTFDEIADLIEVFL